jgi:hypothetical protein
MNVPVEITQLQEFFWNRVQDAVQHEQTLSAAASFLRDLALGIAVPCSIAVLLVSLAALLYQPRIPRGALWVPAFGLFGNVPKFYSHTRPASFCGIFLKSRRRGATHRRQKS